MTKTNRAVKAPVTILATCLALSACGLLDVNNPNNLVEESISRPEAAIAVVNGAQSLVAGGVGVIWTPIEVVGDNFTWIGSRDAWGSLDQGFISDPSNEWSDGAYPGISQARWMSDKAVSILEADVADDPSLAPELARAHLYAGLVHMVIGETMNDFTQSDKRESGPPVGPDMMYTILDEAITHLDAAVSGGNADVKLAAMAVRARAKQSRAIWDKIKPTPNTADPLAKSPGAVADAQAVLASVGGADWSYDLHYSASTNAGYSDGFANNIVGEVNSRKETQVDKSLVAFTAANDIDHITIMDPIDNIVDPAFVVRLNVFKGGDWQTSHDQYAPNSIATSRLMHLIIAEDALANGDNGTFTTEINAIRAMDGLTPYSGQVPAMDLLRHERRVNTFGMGLRLPDMYRFGVKAAEWTNVSDAFKSPGTLLPITLVEIRANCYLNGLGC
jgi:hypothetical protein